MMNKVLQISKIRYQKKYINKIQKFLSDLTMEYPLHDIWFAGVIQELKKNTGLREILFVISDFDEVIGVSILKKTHLEKKICTFRIAENYQRQGIGTMLMKTSLEFLNTNKPIITVSSTKHAEFIPIFKRFNFCLKKVYFGKYRNLKIEYCYNGILLPETILKSQNIVVKDTNDMKTA